MTDRHLSAIRKFALDGGRMALVHYRKIDELEISEKSRNNFVSNADRGVELLLREAIARDFPEDGIMGEEYGHEPGRSGITWVIDPIDGTSNFVRGRPNWCVSIACLHGAEIVAGCIYDPVHNELYLASSNTASTRNGRPIHVTTTKELDRATVGVGLKQSKGDSSGLAMLTRMVEAGARLHCNSSGALSLAYVADGRLDAYVERHLHSWDFFAGALIVRQAGGNMRDFDPTAALTAGAPVIASNGILDLRLPPEYS